MPLSSSAGVARSLRLHVQRLYSQHNYVCRLRGNKGAKSYNVQQAAARGEKKRDDKEAEETPGELVTLPSGIQYREILTGGGAEAVEGTTCEMMYVCTTSLTVTLQRCTLDKL